MYISMIISRVIDNIAIKSKSRLRQPWQHIAPTDQSNLVHSSSCLVFDPDFICCSIQLFFQYIITRVRQAKLCRKV